MKNFENLGQILSKAQQKMIVGGDMNNCNSTSCWTDNDCDLGTCPAGCKASRNGGQSICCYSLTCSTS